MANTPDNFTGMIYMILSMASFTLAGLYVLYRQQLHRADRV